MHADQEDNGSRGMTTRDVARLLRVGEERVRAWIRTGELQAVNTARARCARPRYVVLPHHLHAFEQLRRAAKPRTVKGRAKKKSSVVDFYPD